MKVYIKVRKNSKTDEKVLLKKARKSVINKVTRKIRDCVFHAKEDFLKDFLEHPVTKEIQAGADATNISGTLGGYGCLFSYIGFENGTDPIEPILRRIKNIQVRIYQTDTTLRYTIVVPRMDSIEKATPMPWASGRSWVRGIEHGIAGMGHYFHNPKGNLKNSRSGTAVQVAKKQRSGRYKNTKYLSEMIDDFHMKVRSYIKREFQ